MREIKFRAWSKKGDGMTPVSEILWHNKLKIVPKETTLEGCEVEAKDWELMQYTGLKDKNGAEIYEGDIVDAGWLEKPSPVVFISGSFGIKTGKNDYKVFWGEKGTQAHGYEVVGNTHENPDLLPTHSLHKRIGEL